ncbi:hypothetical protein ACP4OV_005054 [Aristida adscensionis]
MQDGHKAEPLSLRMFIPRALYHGAVYFINGIAAIFRRNKCELVAIDLSSGQAKRIYEGHCVRAIVPYMSFYIPAPGAAISIGVPSTGQPSA